MVPNDETVRTIALLHACSDASVQANRVMREVQELRKHNA